MKKFFRRTWGKSGMNRGSRKRKESKVRKEELVQKTLFHLLLCIFYCVFLLLLSLYFSSFFTLLHSLPRKKIFLSFSSSFFLHHLLPLPHYFSSFFPSSSILIPLSSLHPFLRKILFLSRKLRLFSRIHHRHFFLSSPSFGYCL